MEELLQQQQQRQPERRKAGTGERAAGSAADSGALARHQSHAVVDLERTRRNSDRNMAQNFPRFALVMFMFMFFFISSIVI